MIDCWYLNSTMQVYELVIHLSLVDLETDVFGVNIGSVGDLHLFPDLQAIPMPNSLTNHPLNSIHIHFKAYVRFGWPLYGI